MKAFQILKLILLFGTFSSLVEASFLATESEITQEIKARMVYSWKENNPVALSDLRYITLTHWDFDVNEHVGELIVHKDVVRDLIEIFEELYEVKFLIEKMVLIDEYEANDDLSMEDNNTSAFCSRAITGIPKEFSLHSYGTAIDINPKLNPFVEEDLVLPESGLNYLKRDEAIPGLISLNGLCYQAFKKHNWHWGGDGWEEYPNRKDYQHFEKELVSVSDEREKFTQEKTMYQPKFLFWVFE